MAPPPKIEDDLKLLYTYIQLSPVKAQMSEVAKHMGLKTGATSWRFNTLMKKLNAEFGDVGRAAPSPASTNAGKRKRGKKEAIEEESPTKNLKTEEVEVPIKEEAGDKHGPIDVDTAEEDEA